MTLPASNDLFLSFWHAGYGGADHVARTGETLSMKDSTQHAQRAAEDYALLREFGIRTVRESVAWNLVEHDGDFDFSGLEARAKAAREQGLQVIWTLCHYGWPAGLDAYSPEFVERFAGYCRAVARFLAPFAVPDAPPVFAPVNEISFTCRAAAGPHDGDGMPGGEAGRELKRQLVRAAIAGCDAIWEEIPGARIMHCDPLIHVVAPHDRPELETEAAASRELQFEAWDMLCGRMAPELGGAPRYLDIVGVNYHHDNQWEAQTNEVLEWRLDDPRRRCLHHLLEDVWQRYRRPLAIAETSHFGNMRGPWVREIAQEAAIARARGMDLTGICLNPIIDHPDWDDAGRLHGSGLWDVRREGDEKFKRVLSQPYAATLRQAQRLTRQLDRDRHEPSPSSQGACMPAIIVFSHLRWNFVFQRPQHLLTRMAEHYPVVFIEEPVYDEHESRWEISMASPNVMVCRPHTTVAMPGFHDDQLPQLRRLMRQLVADYEDHYVWFYTPMALPLLQECDPKLVVYDCMDELAAFKNAPRQLLQRENAVLKVADVVFTGGPSLYEAKKERHPAVYCFPSSVDAVHFEQALDRTNSHPAHKDIPGPRLGFYGVIDERFDPGLISRLADAHPQWHIVLVGPVVKIDPAALPRRPNIHYMGQQPYKALPHFLAGWDVCLLPFALNESTRFISPTKTLEYMAAELPIVSTPVKDVADFYSDIVYIAADADEFVAACEAALLESVELRARKIARMREVLSRTSWDKTAGSMHELMEKARRGKKQASVPLATRIQEPAQDEAAQDAAVEPAASINTLRAPAAVPHIKTVVIGAGATGLSAAYHLDKDVLLLERNASVGGGCRSVADQGFVFDCAGHVMYPGDEYVQQLYQLLLGDNKRWQTREAWVYSKGVHTRHPFHGSLYGLPPKVVSECIVGAMEVRFANAGADAGKPRNAEEFIQRTWGAGIARHFAIPYNRKLWTVPLTELDASWLAGRAAPPDPEQMIEGALAPRPAAPNARFGYPAKGGFQALMNGFLPHIKGSLELNADVVQVSPAERIVALADGRRFHYDSLISTMPLPELVRRIGAEAPERVREAAEALRCVSVRCVNIGVGRENITDKHWIYYPEDAVFHRVFMQGNVNPECNPAGGFGLTCEISYAPWAPLPAEGQHLVERCVADLIKVGLLRPDDAILTATQVDLPYAYVLYDHERAANVALIKAWLAQHDIVPAGRYGEWEYYNADHAFLAGRKAAETAKWMQPRKSAAAE